MLRVPKFQVSTLLTCLTMDSQMHAIGKTVRPLLAAPVTYLQLDQVSK